MSDSARMVARAIAAIRAAEPGDTLSLRVLSFKRDSAGTEITLVPSRLIQGGGGIVRFARNGSIARVLLSQ